MKSIGRIRSAGFVLTIVAIAAVGCASQRVVQNTTPRQSPPTALANKPPPAGTSTDVQVTWRSERWPELGLQAQVFAGAPTNTALYVRLVEWKTAAGRLRIQIDSEPELASTPLRPLVRQKRWRSGGVETIQICGRPAQRLRVQREGFVDPSTKLTHHPLREVRVRFLSKGKHLRVTWAVESARPSDYAGAEAAFFRSLRCFP